MHCPNCGTQTVSNAKFCHVCASLLNTGLSVATSPSNIQVLETCTVRAFIVANSFVPFKKRTWQWFAEGLGPDGAYTVAVSSSFKAMGGTENTGPLTATGQSPAESEAARIQLVAELLRSGWEPIDAYGREYRRVVNQS